MTASPLPSPDGADKARLTGSHPWALPIALSDEDRLSLASESCKAFPGECCGFLLGKDQDGIRQILEVIHIDNAAPDGEHRRFSIPPLQYMKAERYAAQKDVQILGVYHSHPSHAAVPSVHDLKLALPFFSYLILAVRNSQTPHVDHMQSWQLDSSGIFREETFT